MFSEFAELCRDELGVSLIPPVLTDPDTDLPMGTAAPLELLRLTGSLQGIRRQSSAGAVPILDGVQASVPVSRWLGPYFEEPSVPEGGRLEYRIAGRYYPYVLRVDVGGQREHVELHLGQPQEGR